MRGTKSGFSFVGKHVFIGIVVLLRWGAGAVEDFSDFAGVFAREDGFAIDGKLPVFTVVKKQVHGAAGFEDVTNVGGLDAGLTVVFHSIHVSEEGIFLGAVVGVFKIIVKAEGVIEIEAESFDTRLGEVVEGGVGGEGEPGGEVFARRHSERVKRRRVRRFGYGGHGEFEI